MHCVSILTVFALSKHYSELHIVNVVFNDILTLIDYSYMDI